MLRGALVGFGFIAEKGHLPAYLAESGRDPGLRIVAVADPCPARRAAAASALPGARIYPDHQALLAAEAAGLDFVDVATPPAEHARVAHAALERRLHVLCEKPLATSVREARSVIEHAARVERVVLPCHNYAHAPVVRTIREVLDSGRIGTPRLITLDTYRTTHARGTPEWRPDWRRERRWSGGGIAMDHGSHTFYLAFDWLGAYPTSVSAHMATSNGHDTEDNVSCVLRFPTGLATARLSWTAGVRKVVYTIHGDRGAVTVNDDEVEVAVADAPDGRAPRAVERSRVPSLWMDASHSGWFVTLLDRFAAAVGAGETEPPEAHDALACVRVIETAYASARAGGAELDIVPEATVRRAS